jgi:hypothetical protein
MVRAHELYVLAEIAAAPELSPETSTGTEHAYGELVQSTPELQLVPPTAP